MATTGLKSNRARKIAAFDFLLPKLAQADDGHQHDDLEALLGEQIAKAREIFLNETFDGNGRTCGTCHRPDNNHTIDPTYIAKLPKDDPLFVAEYNTALKDLEKPELMRQFGLILANLDGFDNPGVMRSAPHTLALATSAGTELLSDGGEFPEDAAFANALGWSGDGAPDSGSLNEFMLGAIVQHFTKTLKRRVGEDFTLPSDEDLLALEAYMLFLGRSKDFDLTKLNFDSPLVQKGKLLFDTKENPVVNGQVVFGETANCSGCHMNAGARSSSTKKNPTRDTGVEKMHDPTAIVVDPGIPADGGFGKEERGNCGPEDALEVLTEGQLLPNPQVIDKLEGALRLETLAKHSPGLMRDSLLQKAIERKNAARGLIVSCDPNASGSLIPSQRGLTVAKSSIRCDSACPELP